MCNNVQQQMSHASRHCTSWVAGPGQCPGIHQVNWAAISSLSAWISTGKVVVVAMCAVATATSIASLDDCSISSLSHRQAEAACRGWRWWAKHTLPPFPRRRHTRYLQALAGHQSWQGLPWKRIISPWLTMKTHHQPMLMMPMLMMHVCLHLAQGL